MPTRSVTSLLAGLLLALHLSSAQAVLQIEALALGTDDPTQQSYNLQEQRELRVFARSAAGFKRAQIFWQRRVNGEWQAAQPWPFADARWRDSDPHLSADGKTLTFISDRPAEGDKPLGQLDLYESRWVDGQWATPQRLAEAVQSPAYELGPERYGERLYFASNRPGGPGALAIYQSERFTGGEHSAPIALPAPINVGLSNSDFTLSPDGRYALWWSDRSESQAKQDGDLFLAERVGAGFGPAIRLPAPVNSPGTEFTPSVSSDGRWLVFASTRPGQHAAGLSQLYRVSWPALLAEVGPQAEAHSQAQLEQRIGDLWRTFNSKAGGSPDTELLRSLLHPQARIWGQRLKDASLDVRSWTGTEFLAALKETTPKAVFECEVHRELRRHGAHAQVYSVVETRHDSASALPAATGVNSSQWQLGPLGWQLLSLHYALELPGQAPAPHSRASGDCIG
nr:hypothetical protein [uncultured Roseateles sp.]